MENILKWWGNLFEVDGFDVIQAPDNTLVYTVPILSRYDGEQIGWTSIKLDVPPGLSGVAAGVSLDEGEPVYVAAWCNVTSSSGQPTEHVDDPRLVRGEDD